MDFEQLSDKYKGIKSPIKIQSSEQKQSGNKSSLFEIIQKEDSNSKKQSKRFYLITSITAIVYILVFIVNPDPNLTIKNRLAGSCYIIASIILAILFWKKHKQLKESSYLSSSREFLKEAKKRFQFWNKKQLWFIAVIILVNIASLISLTRYIENLDHTKGIFIYEIVFFVLFIFGFLMGKRSWTKNKKPILLKIEKMLISFEE